VALLGGTLKIESPPGGGVTLRVEIPSPYPSV
jgi:signal transduction histidine kinase